MAEAVDGLELVPDEEDVALARLVGEEIDQVALEAIGVLELVDHDRLEAQRLPLADLRVVAEKRPRSELEILEVERRLAALRRRVRLRKAVQELLEEIPVAHRELVEGRLLDGDTASSKLADRSPRAR